MSTYQAVTIRCTGMNPDLYVTLKIQHEGTVGDASDVEILRQTFLDAMVEEKRLVHTLDEVVWPPVKMVYHTEEDSTVKIEGISAAAVEHKRQALKNGVA